MNAIDTDLLADRLNRLVKLAMDTGEAASVEEAEKLFSDYRLAIAVGEGVRWSATQQAALLTIVNCGRRSLLGGVEVEGIAGMPLLLPLYPYRTLEEAVLGLGGRVVAAASRDVPLVVVGDGRVDADRAFAIRTTFDGWAGGVVPARAEELRLAERQEFIPSGVLSGAVAVAEVFQHLRQGNPAACRRSTGLSLWRPEDDWQKAQAVGPVITRLPSAVWLIGIGNVGQAYLWTIGLLPYEQPNEVQIVLQDYDILALSNDSTSLLTHQALIGARKTRAIAHWAERRGFKTSIVERRFAADFRVGADDPAVALCGVDNALARAALEDAGFARVIEAGLGYGIRDYLGFRTHVFPAPRRARDIWRTEESTEEILTDLPAYRALTASGADQCGLTQLAGRTVGAPFVGAVAAAVVIGELLRTVNGGHSYELIDGHLRNLDHRTVLQATETGPFNPGSTGAVSSPVGPGLKDSSRNADTGSNLRGHANTNRTGTQGTPRSRQFADPIRSSLLREETAR